MIIRAEDTEKAFQIPERNFSTLILLRPSAARMRRGITQEAFAEEIDISISYYQKLERGARSCSLDILVLIAEHLHVTTDYLLTGKKAQADEIKAALRASSQLLEELAAKI